MIALDLKDVSSAAVLAPHPDDEVIAAFGLIRTLRRLGACVRVTVVTDGAASHRNSIRWPAAKLRAARRAESCMALARAGVRRTHIRFLNRADGSLGAYDHVALRDLARALGRAPTPNLLILPSTADDHPDHRAVACAAKMTWPGCARRMAYIVWPGDGHAPRPMTHAFHLGMRERAMKRAAIRCHRTQTGLIDDDSEGFKLTPAMIARFSRPIEYFRRLP